MIYCFQSLGNFTHLTGAFFQSWNSSENGPCRDKWSNRTGRILAEYYLRIHYIRPLGSETTLGLHFSTSLAPRQMWSHLWYIKCDNTRVSALHYTGCKCNREHTTITAISLLLDRYNVHFLMELFAMRSFSCSSTSLAMKSWKSGYTPLNFWRPWIVVQYNNSYLEPNTTVDLWFRWVVNSLDRASRATKW